MKFIVLGCTLFFSFCICSDGVPAPCTGLATMDGDIVTVGEDGKMNFLTSHQSQVVRTIESADSFTLHCVCFLKHNEVSIKLSTHRSSYISTLYDHTNNF